MDTQFIRDAYYRTGSKDALPSWMHDTRYERLCLLDKWLDGTFYNAIGLSFDEEVTTQPNPMRARRPATKAHLPAKIAGLSARKLFGGRHIPRVKHKNVNFVVKVQALIEELKLPVKMLEAVKRGSVGSILILFKFLSTQHGAVKGVVNVKQTQYCTPASNEFEELIGVMEHYIVQGKELIKRGMVKDRDTDDIAPGDKYWFIKMIDTEQEVIYVPIKERKWNPVEGSAEYEEALIDAPIENNPFVHNLGFVQGVWIKNLTGGTDPDGLGTWELALDNFLTLDYQRSQNDRGLKYGSAPQLVIKGDLKDEVESAEQTKIYRSPSFEIRLAADEKGMDGQSASTGHDAKLLETNGAASKASDEFVHRLEHSAMGGICAERKDLESISGAVSGKAIALMDEDYLDLIQELRLMYCMYGYLPLLKKICKAALLAGHELMQGADETMIDGLILDFPPMYLPDPQDIQFLADAFVQLSMPTPVMTKNADGTSTAVAPEPILDPAKVREYFMAQLDMPEESIDRPVINDTQVESTEMPDPQPFIEVADGQEETTVESGLMDSISIARRNKR